uniref:G protein-coupled receptor n=1 Tax=Steinernema glaseri TaxID=37863 RepID=A0A1I7ZSA3_9BILA
MSIPIGLQYQEKYERYFLFVTCIVIVVASLISLLVHIHRSKSLHRWGMLPVLLANCILYSLMNILYFVLYKDNYDYYTIREVDIKLVVWQGSVNDVTEVVMSLASTLLALDRVLVMTWPLLYHVHNMGRKLAAFSCFVTLGLYVVHSSLVLLMDVRPEETFFGLLVYFNYSIIEKVLPSALVIEALLHIVFCIHFQRFSRRAQNAIARKQAAQVGPLSIVYPLILLQVNHITLFQIVSHTLLCALPHLVIFVEHVCDWEMDWINCIYPFYSSAFCVSVLLFTLFTLYKLKPTKCFEKVHSNSVLYYMRQPT